MVVQVLKHRVPDRVKPSFVIFDIRALRRSALNARVPGCQKLRVKGLTFLPYPYALCTMTSWKNLMTPSQTALTFNTQKHTNYKQIQICK